MISMKLHFACAVLLAMLTGVASFPLHAVQQNTVENSLAKAKAAGTKPNRLIDETSPYLLQHAYNPVDWYPWGDAAFDKARKENKPIFLSIGYSTCHWCHVMAHESFENEAIAKLLNQHFVAIKVDREERPDIDNVYMAATELINGHGGWPMTVFLNQRLEPFHAGTYFPPETRGEHRGLKGLLVEIQRLWSEQRERVDDVALQITARIKANAVESSAAEKLRDNIHPLALAQIAAEFDPEDGGFGDAPKFPRPGIFMYLLALAEQQGVVAERAKAMMQTTLKHMAQGGLYDQLGGGFHRYSVDAEWQVPHFEKMLYSQALAVMAYARMYQLDAQPLYKQVVTGTLDFVLREMTSPAGGFYSALDADSERADVPGEHAEGAYYLWYAAELEKILGKQSFEVFAGYYSVLPQGNISSDPQNEFGQRNILRINDIAEDKAPESSRQAVLDNAKQKLIKVRELRPRPHLDDKIVTAWNGMMISALIDGYRAFGEKRWLVAAQDALKYVHTTLLDDNTGRLLRRARGSAAGIAAGLDDYAWTVRASLDVYSVVQDKALLALAVKLQQTQDAQLLDESQAGYFDSDDNDHTLLFRTRTAYDGALPAANAVSVENLKRLSVLTGEKHYRERADKILAAFAAVINQTPAATAMMLQAQLIQPGSADTPQH